MRIVIQRVSSASVLIEKTVYSNINKGLLILLGIGEGDDELDADWLCQKIISLRIFNDAEDKMNLALTDLDSDLMVVSQFTLFASTAKGNRPSFTKAAHPSVAIPLYEYFIQKLETLTQKSIATGRFGTNMQISLINDGPVTIFIDSKVKE
ncbi:MAG: D-tyrosyl-tRNA(Tyr) deacylase [Bacteroidetes bacterium]|nr:D-tyrosyl-tRNA(Tyr) deacylase [Bacteroidota bacterium]